MPPARRSRPQQAARRSRSQQAAGRSRSQQAAPRSRRGPARRRSDLLPRVLVAIPAAIVAIVFIDLGGLPFALFLIAIGLACMQELYRMLSRWRPVSIVGFAALIGMVLGARYGSQREVMEVAVAALPVLFLFVVARGQSHTTVAIAGTLLGIYWIGFAFAHAMLLRQVPHGNGVIIDVLIGTFVGDTAAYLSGRLFGRRLLAPAISPNKTLEGLCCGMFVAIVSVFLAGLYQDWLTQGDALLLGVAVAVLGPIGDLFESIVKRDAGAKDTGTLFGPHGGALDRADAVMFTIVAGYYIWIAVMH
jgi:phosphatidate cytidylyltransferase